MCLFAGLFFTVRVFRGRGGGGVFVASVFGFTLLIVLLFLLLLFVVGCSRRGGSQVCCRGFWLAPFVFLLGRMDAIARLLLAGAAGLEYVL